MNDYKFSIHDAMQEAAVISGITDWQGYRWEACEGGCIVTGCVPSGVFTKGKNKGQPKFRPAMPGTDRRVVVGTDHMQAVAQLYEAARGCCWDCKGTGEVWAGWSADSGARYRKCTRCNGSGKATGASE